MEKMFYSTINSKDTQHIFKMDGRSLCRKWLLFRKPMEDEVWVKGTEELQRDDCKSCHKAMKRFSVNAFAPQSKKGDAQLDEAIKEGRNEM